MSFTAMFTNIYVNVVKITRCLCCKTQPPQFHFYGTLPQLDYQSTGNHVCNPDPVLTKHPPTHPQPKTTPLREDLGEIVTSDTYSQEGTNWHPPKFHHIQVGGCGPAWPSLQSWRGAQSCRNQEERSSICWRGFVAIAIVIVIVIVLLRLRSKICRLVTRFSSSPPSLWTKLSLSSNTARICLIMLFNVVDNTMLVELLVFLRKFVGNKFDTIHVGKNVDAGSCKDIWW